MNEQILTLLNEMKTDIKSLKEDIHTLKEDVHTLKEDVHTLKEDVHTLKEDVHTLKFEQETIKVAVLELKDTDKKVDSLAATQENQQQIIELLSARSIEQEAELKEIKLKTS